MSDAARLQAVLGAGYRLDREVGRGGMATVYLAHDLKHGRKVAVKLLHPGLEVIGGAERFRREIEIAATLSHPNILALLDSGEADGLRWYLMPFVEGETLRQRLDREGQLSLAEALRITRGIGAALSHAHRKGLIHRDVKPENVLLTEDQVLVADFGIARMAASNENLTATGFSLGTPNYMSPEQAMTSRQIDARSDLYSLGCVCYELLAGHPPFLGTSWQEVMSRHAIDSVPSLRSARPSVPVSLERTLERTLAKTPADRFATVADFLAALPSEAEIAAANTGAGVAAAVPVRSRRPWARWLAGALVAAVVIAGAIWALRGRATPAAGDGRVLLAVLPLRNLGDAKDEYFADGLAEEIATRLSRVRGIAVIARNNQIRASETVTAQDIGRQLGVRYVLDGSVAWAADPSGAPQVRIRPQLVDVATGVVSGLGPFTEIVANVFDLQTRLALEVVGRLQIELGDTEQAGVRASATRNVDAYKSYSLGRFYWKKRTADGLARAVAAFDSALALDPGYAKALAGLADAYILYPQYGVTTIDGGEAFRRAAEAASRALTLDSTLAEAHASLGEIATYAAWDWPAAEGHLRRAIQLDPGYATAHHWYAELLTILGRQEEARVQADSALALDPTSAVIAHAAAHPLYARGLYREAIPAYRRVLELDPGFDYARFGLIRATALSGDPAGAERLLREFGDTTVFMAAWVRAIADSTRRPEARHEADRAAAVLAALAPHLRAPILAGLGRDDEAIAVLEEARRTHHFAILGLESDPLYHRLRSNPRFAALRAEMKLAGR